MGLSDFVLGNVLCRLGNNLSFLVHAVYGVVRLDSDIISDAVMDRDIRLSELDYNYDQALLRAQQNIDDNKQREAERMLREEEESVQGRLKKLRHDQYVAQQKEIAEARAAGRVAGYKKATEQKGT